MPVTSYLYQQDDSISREELVEFYENLGFDVDGYDFIRAEGVDTGVSVEKTTAGGGTDLNGLERTVADGEIRFSVSDVDEQSYYDVPFADSVNAVLSKKNIGNGLIFVSNTPQALQKVGIPALPVMMPQRHIKDIYNNYAPGGRNAHNMGEQLKFLPQMLEKPVAVIAAKQKNRVIVITQYEDKSGNDIMVPVIIGAETTARGNIRITANIAASSYGKQSVSDMLAAAIEKENSGEMAIFGANKKIASKLSLRGLQLSQWSGFEAVHNINDENSPVKLKVEKNTKSLQFKRWFGKSKVVDENGEPLVIRQTKKPAVFYCRLFYIVSVMETSAY